MNEVRINISGLRDLQRALRASSEGMPKVIQTAGKEAAAVGVRAAKRNAAGTRMVDRITAVGTTRAAAIRFRGHRPRGASKTTDAAVQEWGGRAPLFGNRDHWHTVKPKNPDGYIIYPAIRDTRDEMVEVYHQRLGELLDRHFTD